MPASCDIERWMAVIPRRSRIAGDGAVHDERRVAVGVADDLHVVPADARGVAERLDERLFGGEPAGERAQRQVAFALSEQAIAQRGVRDTARSKRARSTMSIPMPAIAITITRR